MCNLPFQMLATGQMSWSKHIDLEEEDIFLLHILERHS
jgi:hypothetical protein